MLHSLGRLLALPPNMRVCWKGWSGTNALVYYKKPELTAVKSFITLAPDCVFVILGMFWVRE